MVLAAPTSPILRLFMKTENVHCWKAMLKIYAS